jgi:hypothetical protein
MRGWRCHAESWRNDLGPLDYWIRRSIFQDQMHDEVFRAPERICEQDWKGRLQHQVRSVVN